MNADLWIDRSTPATRDNLIKRHLPLVEFLARRVSTTLPNTVEVDDLISYGTFGLLDAIEKFGPSREIKFETYASVRIRGAMIDGLRSGDWLPRQVRPASAPLTAQAALSKSICVGHRPTMSWLTSSGCLSASGDRSCRTRQAAHCR